MAITPKPVFNTREWAGVKHEQRKALGKHDPQIKSLPQPQPSYIETAGNDGNRSANIQSDHGDVNDYGRGRKYFRHTHGADTRIGACPSM